MLTIHASAAAGHRLTDSDSLSMCVCVCVCVNVCVGSLWTDPAVVQTGTLCVCVCVCVMGCGDVCVCAAIAVPLYLCIYNTLMALL